MTPRDDLPRYVVRGGDLVWEPPFVCNDVEVFAYLIPVELDRIDRMLQRDLVVPSRGAVDRRAAFPYVAVVCATMGSSSSADEPDLDRGYTTECEVGFWCLTADAHRNGRLVWYLPYIFVDTAITVVSGREVYGYPKQLGKFPKDFADQLRRGARTKVTTQAIQQFARQHKFEKVEIFSVFNNANGPPPALHGPGHDFKDLFRDKIGVDPDVPSGPRPGAAAAITGSEHPPPAAAAAPPWYARVLDCAHGAFEWLDEEILIAEMALNPTLVFLKQFRDMASSTQACYQAITESQFEVRTTETSYTELEAADYRVTIASPDSSPIAADFGLPANRELTPQRAFHAKFSFLGKLGHEVWQAPT